MNQPMSPPTIISITVSQIVFQIGSLAPSVAFKVMFRAGGYADVLQADVAFSTSALPVMMEKIKDSNKFEPALFLSCAVCTSQNLHHFYLSHLAKFVLESNWMVTDKLKENPKREEMPIRVRLNPASREGKDEFMHTGYILVPCTTAKYEESLRFVELLASKAKLLEEKRLEATKDLLSKFQGDDRN